MVYGTPFGERILAKYTNDSEEQKHQADVLLKVAVFTVPISLLFAVYDILIPPIFLPYFLSSILICGSAWLSIHFLRSKKLRSASLHLFVSLYAVAVMITVVYDGFIPGPRPMENLFLTAAFLGLINTIYFLYTEGANKVLWLGVTANTVLIAHFILLSVKSDIAWQTHLITLGVSALLLNFSLYIGYRIFYYNRSLREKLVQKERKIQDAMANVINGFIPICAGCKSVRTEKGNWVKFEQFIINRSPDATVSHGYCAVCEQKLMDQIDRIPEKLQA